MSQATNRDIPGVFKSKLHSLRMKIGSWVFLEAISRIIPTVLGLLGFIFVVDRIVEMDVPQRVIMLILSAIVVLVVAYYKLVRPMMQHLTDDALLLEVERQNSELRDSLISAVQFSRDIDADYQGVSVAMVNATIEKGANEAGSVNFGTALNSTRFLANLWISIASVLLLGAFVFGMLNDKTMNIFMQRMLFRDGVEYDKNTYLVFHDPDGRIKDGVLTIYRQEHCKLLVHVREDSKIKDVEVFLHYREDGQNWKKHKATRTKRFDGREYTYTYKSVAVDFEVEARGGDGRSRRLKVKLEEPPQFSNLSAEVFYPEYAINLREGDLVRVFDQEKTYRYLGPDPQDDGAWEEIPDVSEAGKKLVEWGLIDGDQLETLVSSVKDETEDSLIKVARRLGFFKEIDYAKTLLEKLNVRSVRSDFERNWMRDPSELIVELGDKLTVMEGCSVKLFADANTRMEVAQLVHGESTRDFTTEDGESYELFISAEELQNGEYIIKLRDETLRTPPKQASLEIEIASDKSPEVKASPKGISGMILNRAKIPLTINLSDDYSVVDAYLLYSWIPDTGDESKSIKSMLGEAEEVPSWDRNDRATALFVSEILPANATKLTAQFLDLDDLENGVKVPEYSRLKIEIVAIDNDNVNGPNETRVMLKDFPVRVVSEVEFREELLRRVKNAGKEFDGIFQNQKKIRNDTEVLAADAKTDDETQEAFHEEMTKSIVELINRQKIVDDNVEKVTELMQNVLTEAMNNRLDESTGEFGEETFTKTIIQPLQELNDLLISTLILKLEETRAASKEDEKRSLLLKEATGIQDQILSEMNKILTEMKKQEGLQAMVNEIHKTLKDEKNLQEKVRQELKKRIKSASGSGN